MIEKHTERWALACVDVRSQRSLRWLQQRWGSQIKSKVVAFLRRTDVTKG